jgi:hypothetical protein
MNTIPPTATARTQKAHQMTCSAALERDRLRAELTATKAECAEKQATFDLMFSANLRGIKMWQDAHPEHSETWPDLARIVAWLLSELTRLRAEVERLDGCCDELHTVIDNAGYPSGKDYAAMTARAEKAEAALAFIAQTGGTKHETECGTISCNGLWCAEQARAAIDAAMKGTK